MPSWEFGILFSVGKYKFHEIPIHGFDDPPQKWQNKPTSVHGTYWNGVENSTNTKGVVSSPRQVDFDEL